jgi:hypothetical protein
MEMDITVRPIQGDRKILSITSVEKDKHGYAKQWASVILERNDFTALAKALVALVTDDEVSARTKVEMTRMGIGDDYLARLKAQS